MKVRSTMSRSRRFLSAHRPSLRPSGLQQYWRTPTQSAETSIRTRRSSGASIFPSRASLGTRRQNFACALRRSPGGPIGCRAKPSGNMPAARARWDPFISGRPSPPSSRTIVEPAAGYAAKATARASPLTSITIRSMNRAPTVRAPLEFFEAKRRPRGHFHPTGLASTICTAMFGSIAWTGRVPTMPMSRWTQRQPLGTFRQPEGLARRLVVAQPCHLPLCLPRQHCPRLLGLAGPHRPQGGLYSIGKRSLRTESGYASARRQAHDLFRSYSLSAA
jgi:hypothetical protein